MEKNTKQPILISLYKSQVQVDQGQPQKTDTLKLIEEKVGKSLEHMGTGEISQNRAPVAYSLSTRIYKWERIKVQSCHKAKDTVNRTKQQSTEWEKIFTNPTYDRGLVSNVYK